MGLKIDIVDKHWNKEHDRDGFVKHKVIVGTVAEAVTKIQKLLKKHKGEKISRLRFFGHGMPGTQLVGVRTHDAKGNDVVVDESKVKPSMIRMGSKPPTLLNQGELAKLSGAFETEKGFWDSLTSTAPPAVVELRGCSVGGGDMGKKLIKTLAQLWQVAVRAAEDTQQSGDKDTTNDWEGDVYQSVNGKNPELLSPAAARS
jgi:hypothetical protein